MERTNPNQAQRRFGPHVGRAFSLLTFSLRRAAIRVQRESEAPCKAQSVAKCRGKRRGLTRYSNHRKKHRITNPLLPRCINRYGTKKGEAVTGFTLLERH